MIGLMLRCPCGHAEVWAPTPPGSTYDNNPETTWRAT